MRCKWILWQIWISFASPSKTKKMSNKQHIFFSLNVLLSIVPESVCKSFILCNKDHTPFKFQNKIRLWSVACTQPSNLPNTHSFTQLYKQGLSANLSRSTCETLSPCSVQQSIYFLIPPSKLPTLPQTPIGKFICLTLSKASW